MRVILPEVQPPAQLAANALPIVYGMAGAEVAGWDPTPGTVGAAGAGWFGVAGLLA